MTKTIKFALLSLLAWTSFSAAAKENEGISLDAKPDVVVETISMLMPHTTKKSMELLAKFETEDGSSKFFDKLNSVNIEGGVKFNFDKSHVYSPYTDPKHASYQNTVLYKMWNPSSQDAGGSLMPMMKKYNFETVLGFFNKIMFTIAMFFVVVAVGRMTWVSMTVEEENKSWSKLIVISPAIMIAIMMIMPMEDINGINMAQMIMVLALLFGNYIAANFSIVTSYFLFQHVVNTSGGEDNEDENLTVQQAASHVNDIAQKLTTSVNTRIFLEDKFNSLINTKILKGKELTDANLELGIDEYNKALEGHNIQLTSACFGADWIKQYFNDTGCRAFINSSDYKFPINNWSPEDNRYSAAHEEVRSEVINASKLNTEGFKFDIEGHRRSISHVTPAVYDVYSVLLERQRAAYCADYATSMHGSYSSYNNRYYYDLKDASKNFVCKKRNANGGFDAGSTEFYGLVLAEGDSGRMLGKPVGTFDQSYIVNTLHLALVNAMNTSQLNTLKKKDETATFFVRGFFISPLESVVTALAHLKSQEKSLPELLTPLKSKHAKRIVLDALYLDREISAGLGDLKSVKIPFTKGIPETNYDVSGIVAVDGWREAFFNINNYVDGTNNGDGSKNLTDIRLKTLEPYSHLLNSYDIMLPLSLGFMVFTGALRVFNENVNFSPNTSATLAMGLVGFLGGLLFLMSMTIKLLTGVLFLYGAISLVFTSLKRFIIYLIASTLMAVKFLKENFSEVDDDEDNITVSRYVVSAVVRLVVDMSMITVAIIGAYIIGTFAANLMSYGVLLYVSTMSVIHEYSMAQFFTTILAMLALDIAIAWGVYKGIQLMPYIYTKTTDFIEDITGVNASEEHMDLIGFVQQNFTPTSYIK